MEMAESSERGRGEREEVRVTRKTLKAVLEQCQRALESLNADGLCDDDDSDDDDDDCDDSEVGHGRENCPRSSSSSSSPDHEAEELCALIKSRLEGQEFLERMETAQLSVLQNVSEEGGSWDMVGDNDLWEGGVVENDQEEYVVVGQEDIADGIAGFMAAYLLSLKQTKDLTPDQLQEALSKAFSLKKKGKLRKALDRTKVIYNVASWSATAIGIYQNPALLRAASTAFWTSCRVISRLF